MNKELEDDLVNSALEYWIDNAELESDDLYSAKQLLNRNLRFYEVIFQAGGPPPPEGYCGGPITLTRRGIDRVELYTTEGKHAWVRTDKLIRCVHSNEVQTVFVHVGPVEENK